MFNDFGVQVPAVTFVTWPDNYYHTSGDRPSILDPTQLRRAIVIAAATAYVIAASDEDGAVRIGAEVAANASKRLSFIQQFNAGRITEASADELAAAYKRALFDMEAYAISEKATLLSVLELSSGNVLKKFIGTQADYIQKASKLSAESLTELAKARGEALKVAIKPVVLQADEVKASKIYPKATPAARETGFGVIRNIPQDIQAKYNLQVRNGAEIARLTIHGNNSILDIKKLLDAQFPNAESLAEVTQYLELLKEVKLVAY